MNSLAKKNSSKTGNQQSVENKRRDSTQETTSSSGPGNNNNNIIDDNACVVCFKNVEIYSIGECDHPVCYECSTRMRVLCQQNECPICRHVLAKVIFTLEKLSYRELESKNRSEYYSKKYKIGFYTAEIQQKFFELLDHPCIKCNCPPYRTFPGLRNHVRKEHDLHYCDLCVENLKIFTFERRCYTQAELGIHRTKGDPDNRSHRGHPLCEYCNKRYLDRDELFRHLRRDHYYCHFCDADGMNEFYRDYAALAQHFRQDHYLCEEGKCAEEEFTGAFRSEIDYKAHVANMHGKGMNKQQAKQTRTLQLEITLGPRGRSSAQQGEHERVANMRARGNEPEPEYEEPPLYQTNHVQRANIDSEQQFPSLGGTQAAPTLSLTRPPPPSMLNLGRRSGLARTKENFPSLGGGNSADMAAAARSSNTGPAPTRSQQHKPPPISSVLRTKPTPATGAIPRTTNSGSGGMVIHVSNRPTASTTASNTSSANKKSSAFDFPALPSGKTKKLATKSVALEEDLTPSGVNLPMTTVSAKHRILVDDYVSVANPANFQKIQMVQKEEMEIKARKEAEAKNAPKLTSQDFPSLGGGSAARSTAAVGGASSSWIKQPVLSEKRQRDLENRKNKVAPPPVFNNSKSSSNSSSNNLHKLATQVSSSSISSAASNGNSKKEKKPKEKNAAKEANNNNNSNGHKNHNNNENKASNQNLSNGNAAAGAGGNKEKSLGQSSNSPTKTTSTAAAYPTNVTVNSVAKPANNLTFTSSSGESYSIMPAHSYASPPDAAMRNQKLVLHFRDALMSLEALEEFRQISQKFREGIYKPDAYYEHCQAALHSQFDTMFPELLALLPDISKQQALYLVHQQRLNTLSPMQRKALTKLEVCSVCKQVLLSIDLVHHRSLHEINQNFPSLNGAAPKSPTKSQKL